MPNNLLLREKQHLANLLEAIQRCVYFLNASQAAIEWPLTGLVLTAQKKDTDLFEALAAINERFAKLQDTWAQPCDTVCCSLVIKLTASLKCWPSSKKTR